MTAAARELWNLASRTVKDALRPGTMPHKRKRETKEAMALSYQAASEAEKAAEKAVVTPSGKRRRDELKASMAQRLAADSLWTLAECMDFTVEEIHAKLNRATTTEQQQVRDWADGGAPANADQGRCVFISPPFCNFRSYLTC